MDTLFADDDALQSLVEGDLSLLIGEENTRQRSESDLSVASTFSSSPTPGGASGLVVEAFVTFNAAIVHIDYPVPQNGWQYRPDLGGNSIHRWDLGNDVCIVARHTTCSKAMRPRDKPCRNCEMKKTWRRECKESCNTFFLFALDDASRSLQILAPLVHRTVAASTEEVRLYTNFVPKLVTSQRKRGREGCDPAKMARMIQLERNLRFSILNGGSGRVASVTPPQDAGEQLLGLLMDDVSGVLDSSADSFPVPDSACAVAAVEEPTDTEATPMEETETVQLSSFLDGPMLDTPTARRPKPIVATVISSPMRKRNIAMEAYDTLLDRLIDFDAKMEVVILPSSVVPLISRFPLGFHGIAELHPNALLTHLYQILGIQHQPILVVKSSVLQSWMQRIVTEEVRVKIGFVSMPSLQIYHDVRTQPLLPCFLTETDVYIHETFDLASSACVTATTPLMCAYYEPHGPNKVYGHRILPIGV